MPNPQYNAPLEFPQESGIVHALQNDLTLRASTSGDVILGPNAARPEVDLTQDLGVDFLRWRSLFASSGNLQALTVGDVTVSGNVSRENIVYVAKHGSDDNDGSHPERAMKSLLAAKARVQALGVGQNNAYTIEVLDGGVYGETFRIPPYVSVYAPRATLSGTIDMGDNACLRAKRYVLASSGAGGENLYGIIRRNAPETPATISGVSTVHLDKLDVISETFAITLNGICSLSSGVINVTANSADATSGNLLFAGDGGQIHYDGNEVQLSTEQGLSHGFAVISSDASVVANVNRIRGDSNEKLLMIGGQSPSGYIRAGEIDVQLMQFGLGFSQADVRVFAGKIRERSGSFAVGDYVENCIVEICDIADTTAGSGIADIAQVRTIYVGKHGDDNFDGEHPNRAVQTIGQAITLANALTPIVNDKVTIKVVDAGLYSEDITVPSFVKLSGPSATVSGQIDVSSDSDVALHKAVNISNGSTIAKVIHAENIDRAQVVLDELEVQLNDDVHFIPIGVNAVNASVNVYAHSIRNISGVVAATASASTITLTGDEVYMFSEEGVQAHGTLGLLQATDDVFHGRFNRIRGEGSQTTGLSFNTVGTSGSLNANDIVIDGDLYDVSATFLADCRIIANSIQGNEPDPTNNTVCVVDVCEIASGIVDSGGGGGGNPVDARAVTGSIIPDTDCAYPLGSIAARFERVTGCSGVFDHLQPATSGGAIDVGGHLVPTEDDVYDLGTEDRRWATIHAASGQLGDLDILAGGDITVANGQISCPLGNIGGLTMTANIAGFTVAYSTQLLSLTRPEFHTAIVLEAGSGLGLRNENIWYDHPARSTEAVDVESLALAMDNISTRTLPVALPDANSCVLADHFTIVTLSATSSPSDWRVDLRRTQRDGTLENGGIVASGVVGWSNAADASQKTWGRWETSGNVPVEFEPGACYDIIIHNNGSGTAITAPSARLSLGFRINAPNLGRGA